MKEEQAIVLMLKGLIAEAPEESRAKINEAAAKIREVVAAYGDEGGVAIALVGAEVGAAS